MKTNAALITNILITTTLFSGTILASTLVSADNDSVVDQINITVPVSCTLSGTGMDTHNAEINNGQYNSAIGETTLKAFCNDNNGFAIYAIGYTDNEDGKNVLTNSTLGSTHDIVTGTALSGDTSNWAMKLSTITSPAPTYPIIIAGSTDDTDKEQGDPDYSTFQEVPDDYALVAKRTAGTDIGTTAEGATLKSTYQAYISKTQPAGTYSGQVKYTLVHPNDVAAPTKPIVCNPSGTTIGVNTDTDIICMQDVSSLNKSTILSSMTEGQQYTLIDKRDEKSYTIAKLADNNIWMTQNLDLDLDSGTTYTNEDTDLGWNESTNSYGVASWTPIRSTYSADANTWCVGGTTRPQYGDCLNDTPESYDPGNIYWNGVTWPQDGVSCETAGGTWRSGGDDYYCDDVSPATFISLNGDSHYQLGNYYNWNAAVAVNDSSSFDVSGELVEQSICPVGWTLPRVGSGDDTFGALWNEYGFNSISYNDENGNWIYDVGEKAIWTSPLYFTIGGAYDSSLHLVGRRGQFWSPIMFNNILSKPAGFDSAVYYSVETTGALSLKSTGFPIRCIAR